MYTQIGSTITAADDIIWTETTVEAGNKVTLESGTDTNLIGAQVRGEQVVADVGTSEKMGSESIFNSFLN